MKTIQDFLKQREKIVRKPITIKIESELKDRVKKLLKQQNIKLQDFVEGSFRRHLEESKKLRGK